MSLKKKAAISNLCQLLSLPSRTHLEKNVSNVIPEQSSELPSSDTESSARGFRRRFSIVQLYLKLVLTLLGLVVVRAEGIARGGVDLNVVDELDFIGIPRVVDLARDREESSEDHIAFVPEISGKV